MTIFNSYKLTEFNSLLEIPVYRLDPTSFEKELQKELDRICSPLTEFENLFPKSAKEEYQAHRHQNELHIGYPWKFNEIIGWVLPNIDGSIFSGELFYKEGKLITKGSRHKINYKGESFRFDVKNSMTDLDIYSHILIELKGLTKMKNSKGRYIDTHRFETIGKHINWRELFVDLNE